MDREDRLISLANPPPIEDNPPIEHPIERVGRARKAGTSGESIYGSNWEWGVLVSSRWLYEGVVVSRYFVIENEKVFEMDLIPDGASGSSVTNAV